MKNLAGKLVRTCLLLTAGSACFGIGLAAERKEAFRPAEWAAASDERLDNMRGGFDAGSGLSVSFGIVKTVMINGNIITEISFNLPDVSKITAETARIVSDALAKAGIVQNGAGNIVDAGVKSAVAAGTAGTLTQSTPDAGVRSAVAAGTAGTLTQSTPDAGVRSAVAAGTAAGTLIQSTPDAGVRSEVAAPAAAGTLIQSTPDVGVRSQLVAGAAVSTLIQNTLNDQKIQTLTVINAGVNSLGLLKAMNTQTILKDALLGSMGIK